MDLVLKKLCNTVKKVANSIYKKNNELSLNIITGRSKQGKTNLLKQSSLHQINLDPEIKADIFYNEHGIILELGEPWIQKNTALLSHALKHLNRCHSYLQTTGIILCIDIQEILNTDPASFTEYRNTHIAWLNRFTQSLDPNIKVSLIFTKMDVLAGFCDFFEYEQTYAIKSPLGFSLNWNKNTPPTCEFKTQFEMWLASLDQTVLKKIHPVRCDLKRSLIREFPLQLANIGRSIQLLLQGLSSKKIYIDSIYFTSAEQGDPTIDKLNEKIANDFALVTQDYIPQAINHRSYFIQEAIIAIQLNTKFPAELAKNHNKKFIFTFGITASALIAMIFVNFFINSKILDNINTNLLSYDTLESLEKKQPDAIMNVAKASSMLDKIQSHMHMIPSLDLLKEHLHFYSQKYLAKYFIPSMLATLEQIMLETRNTQAQRYNALKVYLMLDNPQYRDNNFILKWFTEEWSHDDDAQVMNKKITLLTEILTNKNAKKFDINTQLVNDVRNYLNALPKNYLYYGLAKSKFPNKIIKLQFSGFDTNITNIYKYYTYNEFYKILASIPQISKQLKQESWVLNRKDYTALEEIIIQAYCEDYVNFWKNLIHHTLPLHFQNYKQAMHMFDEINKSSAVKNILSTIQNNVSPKLQTKNKIFNTKIASQFTDLSLLSKSAINKFNATLLETTTFIKTIAIMDDNGKTAFNLTKARFQNTQGLTPLNTIYYASSHLPMPLSNWAKQIADDLWYILIKDTGNYINQVWQQTIVREYNTNIKDLYPFNDNATRDVALNNFEEFFAPNGRLNLFISNYIQPFLDTSSAQWKPKALNEYMLPFSDDTIKSIMRANIITNMFFAYDHNHSDIQFSLEKISLDPMVNALHLTIGGVTLSDSQSDGHIESFHWPSDHVKLSLNSIDGKNYDLEEFGPWAFFKLLQKVNVLVDANDASDLQILFEINGNSGRYILKTQNQINPFTPGILNDFILYDKIV